MRLLITNDDGFDAPGLEYLISALKDNHDVRIVAPSENRTGAGASITTKGRMWDEEISTEPLFHSLTGTPVDCVGWALSQAEEPFEMIVSGINDGYNLGHDVFFSGTFSACLPAVIRGFPAVALSHQGRVKIDSEKLSEWINEKIPFWFENWQANTVWNINIPANWNGEVERSELSNYGIDTKYRRGKKRSIVTEAKRNKDEIYEGKLDAAVLQQDKISECQVNLYTSN